MRDSRRKLARLGLALCLFMGMFAASAFAQQSAKTNTVRFMSYNIHYGTGMDGVYSLENIAAVVKKSEADVVGLQEIGDSTMAATLGKLTGMHVLFGASLGTQKGYGDAVLSKFPFKDAGNLSIPSASSSRYQAMAVDLDLSSVVGDVGTVRFINTHFDWLSTPGSKHARLATVDVIEEAFFKQGEDISAILTADLNSTPDSEELAKLKRFGWNNYVGAEPFLTIPSTGPKKQIDYVLYRTNRNWKVKDAFVMYGEESSDHLPIVMDLEIR